MVHNAYDSFQLLTNCPAKIKCAASYGPKLLLGCIDGSLRIYAPESSASSSPSNSPPSISIKREPYVVENTVIGFWKKPLLAMEVSISRDLLISLSESISIHRVTNLEPFTFIAKAKGANAYAWDDRRGYLCFARQKRVGIFRYDGGREFSELKDFTVPDVVKSMAWCGENICLGIRKEYMILNSTNGSLSDVFSSGRIASPLVVSLPSGELLLGKDNIGVFVDQNGKLLQQQGRIVWSESPVSVVIQMSYAIASLSKHIEIRSLRDPYQLMQTVSVRDVHHLFQSNNNNNNNNNSVVIVLENSVYGLLPVPLGAQIVQLTASGDFDEALALCKLLPPEDSTLRVAKEASIHIRYGHYLFDKLSYEDAMEQFLASSVDVTYVLSLYPYIIIPTRVHSYSYSYSFSEPEKVVPDFASDASDEIDPSSPSHLIESDEKIESKKMSHNALMGLIKFLHNKRYSIIERATAEGTEEAVSDAVTQGSSIKSSSRSSNPGKSRGGHIHISSGAREMAGILDTALLQALLHTGQSSAALDLLKGVNYCDIKICEEFLQERNCYTELLELYKCNEMHREALKILNQLVEEEESKSNQMNAKPTRRFKPEMIIEYLKPLCSIEPMLVLEYSSKHCLESCPTETVELFINGNIPADLVNSYLKQNAPKVQATYLELMISMNGNDVSANLQNELILIYLSEILDWYVDLKAQQSWDEKACSPTRKKLLSALEGISGYNPETLLKKLPADAFYEEHAILLGKMNQHQLALSLYIQKLQVPELAIAYCDRVYEFGQNQPSSKSYSNIYQTLLQIYLNPSRAATKEFASQIKNLSSPQPTVSQKLGAATAKARVGRVGKKIAEIEGADDLRSNLSSTDSGRSDADVDGDEPSQEGGGGGPIMLDQALDLLNTRWDRINGAQALKLMPKETKLQNLQTFLESLLKKSSKVRRNLSVIKSLRNSENLQVKEELYKQHKTVVKITTDSMCSLCNKRIGTSVFAVYPNGNTLVHFVCFRDSQSIKAVRRSPLQKRG